MLRCRRATLRQRYGEPLRCLRHYEIYEAYDARYDAATMLVADFCRAFDCRCFRHALLMDISPRRCYYALLPPRYAAAC